MEGRLPKIAVFMLSFLRAQGLVGKQGDARYLNPMGYVMIVIAHFQKMRLCISHQEKLSIEDRSVLLKTKMPYDLRGR